MMYLLVFFGMMVVDICYTEYVKATADRQDLRASSWAAGIILSTGFVTTSYVANPWLLIPAVLGAFFGTWISINFLK